MEDLLTIICWVILTPIIILAFCSTVIFSLPLLIVVLIFYAIKDRHGNTDVR